MTDSARSLRITVSAGGDIVTMTVAGELDLDAAPEFRSRADGVVAAGTPTVVLDLAALSFIDSTGVAALLELHRRLAGRTMRLINVAAQPAAVFDMTGLTGTDLEIVKALAQPPSPSS